MSKSHPSTLFVGVLALLASATLATGVTFAATSTHGVKACANSKEMLRLLTSHNHCPHGYHKTTIGARGKTGAKGATGPSAFYISSRSNADAVAQASEFTDVQVTDAITVPAGKYAINADTQLITSSTTTSNGVCTLWAGPQDVTADTLDSRNFQATNLYATLAQSVSYVATAPTAISLTCSSGQTAYSYAGTLTATAVGAVHTS